MRCLSADFGAKRKQETEKKNKKDGHQHEPPLRPTRGHYEFIRKLICRLSVVTKVNCVKIPYNTEEDVWIIKTRKEIR